MRWTNIGPQPVQNGQVGATITNRLMSGRIAAIAVHPNDPTRWLIGAANGGVGIDTQGQEQPHCLVAQCM